MTLMRFCARALKYKPSPWQRLWIERFDAGDHKIGFNYPNSGGKDALELVALMALYVGIIEQRVVYIITPDNESAVGLNRLAKNLLIENWALNNKVNLCGEGRYVSFRPANSDEVLFNIVIPPGNPLSPVSDADYVILHPHKIGGLRQRCAMRRANRIIYPNLSPRSQCSSRPTSQTQS